jgi:hypothetical protein
VAVNANIENQPAVATPSETPVCAGEWADMAPTGIKIHVRGEPLALELATADEILEEVRRRVRLYRLATRYGVAGVHARVTRAALEVRALVTVRSWTSHLVPEDLALVMETL